MRRARLIFLLAMFLTFLLLIFGCQREQRNFRQAPAASSVVNSIQVSDLHPGGQQIAAPTISNKY
jgi:hypothetical protein